MSHLKVPLPAPTSSHVIDDCNKTSWATTLIGGLPQVRTFENVLPLYHGSQWLHLLSIKVKVVRMSYFFASLELSAILFFVYGCGAKTSQALSP